MKIEVYTWPLAMHLAEEFSRALRRQRICEADAPQVDSHESVVINDLLLTSSWKVRKVWGWKRKSHINVLEAHGGLGVLAAAAEDQPDSRFLGLLDSRVAKGALAKGRSSSNGLQGACKRSTALQIAYGLYPGWCFAPTRLNVADDPTRLTGVRPPVQSSFRKILTHDQTRALHSCHLARWSSNWLRLSLLLLSMPSSSQAASEESSQVPQCAIVLEFRLSFAVLDLTDSTPFFPRASERRVLPIVGVCKTSSHLHIFSSSHLLIFTSSYPHIFSLSLIFSSSHLLIFTSSHLHTFSSSHLLIFTSSHPHIFSSSSHLHIFSSPHLLIFTSSHLHIFSSSHLLIFTSSHIFSSSHLLTSSHIFSHLLTSSHIFSHLLTSSHLHIFSSHIFSSCPLDLLPSCPLLLFYFSFEGGSRGSANETARNATLSHEMRVDRQKLRKKLRFYLPPSNPFARNEGRSSKTEEKLRFYLCRSNPFARNEGRSSKTDEKLRFYLCRSNPFARNEGRSSKTEEKLRFCLSWSNPFARNEGRSSKTGEKMRFYLCRSNPFARNEGRSSKTVEKLRLYLCWSNPFARNEGRSSKTEEKLQFYLCRTCLCVKAPVCKKRLCAKASVCKSVCV